MEEARKHLAESAGAAGLGGEAAPAADAGKEALEGLVKRLREALGEARPRLRPGR